MKTKQEIIEMRAKHKRTELIIKCFMIFMFLFAGVVLCLYAYAFYLGYDF